MNKCPPPTPPDSLASLSTLSWASTDKDLTGSISGVNNDEIGIINEFPPNRNDLGVGAGLVVGRLLTVGDSVGDAVGAKDGAPEVDGDSEGNAEGMSVGL